MSNDNDLIFLPEELSFQIDMLPSFRRFDIILVTDEYAGVAIQQFLDYPVYLDRLYTSVPIFVENPQMSFDKKAEKIGVVGFKKVCRPRHPHEYVKDLRGGKTPSVTSVKVCCSFFESYRDSDTIELLRELRRWLSNYNENNFLNDTYKI